MTADVGTIDRVFRIVLGLVLLAAPLVSGIGIYESSIAMTVAVPFGIVMVATTTMRFCPLFRGFGTRTCKI